MSRLHRNSQKRIYRNGAQYFITSATFDRYPYFKNSILAELFVQDLWFAKDLKEFELFGYTVQHDHVHLMFEPGGKFNYSQIMQNIKRVFALHANQIMYSAPRDRQTSKDVLSAGDDIYRHLRWTDKLIDFHNRFHRDCPVHDHIPHFRWQKSFRDHVIRGHQDFLNHLQYIRNNAVKHGVAEEGKPHPFTWVQGMPRPLLQD